MIKPLQITKLSTRHLVLWAIGLSVVIELGFLSFAGWKLVGALENAPQEQFREIIVSYGSIIFIATGALVGLVLLGLNRVLSAREHDLRNLPDRPEFYDYDLLNLPHHLEEFDERPLKSLTFTVFDTETTGLRPSEGDEIIQIAGVRVEGGKFQESIVFDELVNPGIQIPKASIRFHGITDDMVSDKPKIEQVLGEFRDFIGDTILVAHNAAFDMKFLKLKEQQSHAKFENVVLDTLLFSVFLDREVNEHTLNAIAERQGVEIIGRHTALGDSIATAKIFIDMLDRLEARGITTLDQALKASNSMVAVRKLQNQF